MAVLREWVSDPEIQAAFSRMAVSLKEIVLGDSAVLLPQAQERIVLSQWMEQYRGKHFATDLERLFRRELPVLFGLVRPGLIKQIAFENVWPQVEPWLKAIFVRALAAAWAHDKIGDAVTVDQPAWDGAYWVVPIGLPRFDSPLGHVTLDEEGNVVPQESATKADFLRTIKHAA